MILIGYSHKGGSAHEVIVPDDFEVPKSKIFIHKGYAYYRTYKNNKAITHYIHRVAYGAKPREIVDHINGNTLDNRKENLRTANHSTNGANRKSAKGVIWFEPTQKWRARVNKKGMKEISRTFSDYDEAVKWHKEKHIEVWGEYSPYFNK